MSITSIQKILAGYFPKSEFAESVTSVRVFGSQLHQTSHQKSDVDLIIDFSPHYPIGLFSFAQLQRELSEALGTKADIVTKQALSKYIRTDIIKSAKCIYEKSR